MSEQKLSHKNDLALAKVLVDGDESNLHYFLKQSHFSEIHTCGWMLKLGLDYRYLDAEYRFKSELRIDPAFQELLNYPRPERADSKLVAVGIER